MAWNNRKLGGIKRTLKRKHHDSLFNLNFALMKSTEEVKTALQKSLAAG